MPADKTATMAEVIARIDPGDAIACGLALEHAIPFAAGHELIRQGTDDLTLIGPISDVLFDQLIGAGLVSEIRAAWVGNVSAGSAYNFRTAIENDDVRIENHSNFSIALSLKAAALGVPYLPTRSLLGSDIFAENDRFKEQTDPYSGDRLALVPAIAPDWTIVHVQRASPHGDAHFWGNTGISLEGVDASRNVIVTAEEIVGTDVIKSDPSRVNITREAVSAVVECPLGAHPSPLAGRYNRDHEHYLDYHGRTQEEGGFADWADEWVHGVDDRAEYADRIEADLSIDRPSTAAEVQYGQ